MAQHLRAVFFFQRTKVHLPAPTSGGLKLPVTPLARDLLLSSVFELPKAPAYNMKVLKNLVKCKEEKAR